MGKVIMNGPEPSGKCIVCLMDAKQRQWEMFAEEIQAGYAAGGDAKPVIIPWSEVLDREVQPGDYRGVCYEFSQLGVIEPLCWHHMAGINPTQVEDTAPAVPSLYTGDGVPAAYKRPGK
jgi:hypothetical protein